MGLRRRSEEGYRGREGIAWNGARALREYACRTSVGNGWWPSRFPAVRFRCSTLVLVAGQRSSTRQVEPFLLLARDAFARVGRFAQVGPT